MSITDWPLQERPRERLLKFGSHALSNAELVAIFLRTGIQGKTALDMARDLLTAFGSLRGLLEAPESDFCTHKGLGKAKYAQLQAILEINRRCMYENLQNNDQFLCNSQQTKQYLISQLRHRKQEVFVCLFLDIKNKILCFEELFYGTLDSANIYPREVIKRALQVNAAAVIFSHNHPSGCAEPSQEDRHITQRLVEAFTLIDIRVLDHMIVGDNQVTSFAELGLL